MTNISDVDEIKDFGNFLLNKIESGIAVVGSMINERPLIVVAVTRDLIKIDVRAGDLAKEIGAMMGGGGGGKPNLATAGGKDKKSLEFAIKEAKIFLKKNIEEANEL
jgi:alanyl-tRNA synthetase